MKIVSTATSARTQRRLKQKVERRLIVESFRTPSNLSASLAHANIL
jgi:hypothetical protein